MVIGVEAEAGKRRKVAGTNKVRYTLSYLTIQKDSLEEIAFFRILIIYFINLYIRKL